MRWMNHEVKNRSLSIQTQKKNLPIRSSLSSLHLNTVVKAAGAWPGSFLLRNFVLLSVPLVDRAGNKCEVWHFLGGGLIVHKFSFKMVLFFVCSKIDII